MKRLFLLLFVTLIPLCAQAEVHFNSGSAELVPESQNTLENLGSQLSRALKKTPSLVIYVNGHTDSRGTYAENKRLSLSRAAEVRDYLQYSFSIPTDKFQINGFGPDEPIASNDTADGRKQNRRVEVIFVDNKVILSEDMVNKDTLLFPPSKIWVADDGCVFPGQPCTLLWTGGSNNDFLVQVSTSINFVPVIISSATDTRTMEVQIATGTYWVRVACRNASRTHRRFSQPRQFSFIQHKIIQELNLISAARGGSINVLRSPYIVTGKSLPGARILINGTAVALQDDSSFTYPLPLEPGENAVSVKGVLAGSRRTEDLQFTIYCGAVKFGCMLQSGAGSLQGAINNSYQPMTFGVQFGIMVKSIYRVDLSLSGAIFRLGVMSQSQKLKPSTFGAFLGTYYRLTDGHRPLAPYLGMKLGLIELPDLEHYGTTVHPWYGLCCGARYPLDKSVNFTVNLDYLYRSEGDTWATLSAGVEIF